MSIGIELEKLKQLHLDGTLSDQEFAVAKAHLLNSLSSDNTVGSGVHLIGKAAYKFVNFKIISSVIGGVLVIIFFFTFFLPMWNEHTKFSQKVEKDMEEFDKDFKVRQQEFDKDFKKQQQEMDQFRKKNGFN